MTEKPSVAQEFAKVLGVSGRKDGYIENQEYVITWCVGHLVGLVYPESYDMKYKKLYIAYKLDTNFVDVVVQKQRLRISVNMKFSEIHDPKGICKDITGLGRWGNGDVELFMEHTSDVDNVMEIIEQSYRMQAE